MLCFGCKEGEGAVISFELLDMKTVVVSNQWNLWFIWGEIRFFYWDVCISMQFSGFIVADPGAFSVYFTVNLSWGQ